MTVLLSSNKVVRFIFKNHFRKEMTLVVILKLLALFGIWYLFFSNASHHHHPDSQMMVNHFIGMKM